jgi:hypothetical protein
MTTPWTGDGISQLKHMVGDIGDDKLIAILGLSPSKEEVAEAVKWADGEADMTSSGQEPLSGKVAAIFEILTSDIEDNERSS